MRKNLRNKIGRYLFFKEFNHHQSNRSLITFANSRSIGILYDSTNEKHFELVKRYVKEIREVHQKEVLSLGYYDDKELPPMRFSKLGMDFFTRKDLNWHFKPIAQVVRNFVHREFDILIDLHLANSLPFRYVVATSRAKFKIGRYDRAAVRFYDFMLSVDEQITFPRFIEQVNFYLKSLKDDASK